MQTKQLSLTKAQRKGGILRKVWCASRRPPLGVPLFLSLFADSQSFSDSRCNLHALVKKEKRKRTTQGRDGRTARRHHTGILRRGVWCASRRPPLGVRLFLSLFAASRRFSLQPSCHLAVAPFSSWSPLSLLPLSRRSPLPRPATAPPPAAPLLSLLGAALPSLLHRDFK